MQSKLMRALACALAVAVVSIVAAPASAGTYTVYSCGGPAGGANNLFRGQADAGMAAYLANCPVNPYQPADNMGLEARTVKQNASVGALNGAYLILDAPSGARIGTVHADVNMERYSQSPDWSTAIVGFGTDSDRGLNTNGSTVWGCPAGAAISGCYYYVGHVDAGVNKPSVRFEVRCGAPNFGPCTTYATSAASAYFSVWNIAVDVVDSTAPSIGSVSGGLASGSWQRGIQSINWSSSDNVGIKSASMSVDGGQVQSWANSCDYTRVTPCGQLPNGSFSYNTDQLPNGPHTVTVSVTDSAGNSSSWTNTIFVDKSAPAAPAVSTAGNWQNANSFSATVTNANGQDAPVTRIYYQVCNASGGNCGPVQQTNADAGGSGGQTTISGLSAPGDGDFTVRVYEQDSVGNLDSTTLSNTASAHLRLDRQAPVAPVALGADGNGVWQSTNSFRLSWTNPSEQLAPITTAYIVACDVAAACTTTTQSATDINQVTAVSVPTVGDYTTAVYLQDAAGNVAAVNKSDAVHLRFDDTVPGRPSLAFRNGWLNAAEAKVYLQNVTYPTNSPRLPSGITGYSITSDGTEPDSTVEAVVADTANPLAPATATLTGLSEGTVTLKARAVSGSGIVGSVFDAASLRVDSTSPVAALEGAPDGAGWQTHAVSLGIHASDALSGMAAAAANQPVTTGGYINYRIDDGLPTNIAGPTAQVAVNSDGVHTVSYRAYDVAGNPSAEASVKVRIDVTAPSGAFQARDANHPTRFVVDVADSASGVAAGTVEIRRQGGDWRPVDTTYDNAGHLTATLDDSQLPEGLYAMRARVIDNAGNQGVIDTRADGSQMQVALPLRGVTIVEASTKTASVTKCKTVTVTRLRKGKKIVRRLRVCKPTKFPAPRRRGKLVVIKPNVTRTSYVYVHLKDGVGNPIRDAAVTIEEQPSTGGGFAAKAHLATDRDGNLRYPIAKAGPSRTIRARFGGNDQMLPSSAMVQVVVPARTTLKASKRVLRAGGKVVFSGTLAGGYIPAAGKLVNLQVFFRGKWRTFATPRAGSRTGSWRYAYKFTARYAQPLRYRFRALVPVEQAYPFQAGGSSTVAVVVKP